jgi:hypothetical protein
MKNSTILFIDETGQLVYLYKEASCVFVLSGLRERAAKFYTEQEEYINRIDWLIHSRYQF